MECIGLESVPGCSGEGGSRDVFEKNASNQQSMLLIELVTYVHHFMIIESVILVQVIAILTQIAIVPCIVRRRMAQIP